uniref:Uncharacterized protein n=1 Tax=Dactylellina haptotyla TaxID=430498 RepID=B2BK91_9PEZI|nr:hypothetical protein [Dactylellina haptotyla]
MFLGHIYRNIQLANNEIQENVQKNVQQGMQEAQRNVQYGIQETQRNVQNALRNIPQMSSMGMNWGPGCPSSSSPASSSARPSVPDFPKDDEILVDLVTQSINNTFNLKKLVTVKCISGSIKARIVPSPTPTTELVRTLHTHSTTGSQQITVETSLGPFLMDSIHSTNTGSMKMTYPEDWCGTIEITLSHGSYDVRSSLGDTAVVRDVVDPNTRERNILVLKGNPRQGEEFSTMKVKSKTGSIAIRFEKMPPLRDLTEYEIQREEEEARRNERNNQGSSDGRPNKEEKERQGAPVIRPATTDIVDNPPSVQPELQPQQPPQQRTTVESDLPPSYEQSEEENVRIQLAGRD